MQVVFQPDFVPKLGARIKIGNIVNETGETVINVSELFREKLKKALADEDLLWIKGAFWQKLIIDIKITRYRKESFLIIWGCGKLELLVHCNLIDSGTKRKVGFIDVHTTRAVIAAGVLTLGEWKSILKPIAKDVVKALRKKIS